MVELHCNIISFGRYKSKTFKEAWDFDPKYCKFITTFKFPTEHQKEFIAFINDMIFLENKNCKTIIHKNKIIKKESESESK